MKYKTEFTIWVTTEFGTGVIKKKALSFIDAYLKCSPKWRKKALMIEDEDNNSISIDELLGLPLDS